METVSGIRSEATTTSRRKTMSNKAKAFTVLNTFADSRVALIQGMKDAGYTTVEACRPIVIEWACDKTGAEYRWNKAKTKAMLVTSSANYEGAKTTVRDIMLMLEGTTRRASSAKKEPKDAVAKIIEAFAKLTPADQKRALKALVA
jgi:hypothetical protein